MLHGVFRRFFRYAARSVPAAVIAVGVSLSPASASSDLNSAPLTVEHEVLRVQGSGETYDLETLTARPAGPGPWPIALLTHGTPAGGETERRAMSPRWLEQQARDLARRGWAAASVMRRGFGASTGGPPKIGTCSDPDYAALAAAYAADLAAALDAMRRRPWADARAKAVAMGESSCGFAISALAAARPRDVGAAFASNAGVGGMPGTGQVCREEHLVELYWRLGGQSARRADAMDRRSGRPGLPGR